jgi:LuxR family transcriptional regulator, maltose regulon positive regulatory protein
MLETILATKLFIPPPQPRAVSRPRLCERLNDGLHRKLTLISAPAGFGKTTLVSEWVAGSERLIAWLSLDDGDGDPQRFLAYVIAAVQRAAPEVGAGLHAALTSPQPPSAESILTVLINDLASGSHEILLVLDDYHLIDATPVDHALTFLIDHLPPQMHLVITTREDPQLPLARLRTRGQMIEMRAADLRFTHDEAAAFINEVMGLDLSASDLATLETRTEGWIAGLQLAALSMRGRDDIPGFIRSFAGDDRYIVDYLVEEVLRRQPEHIRAFLLQTSVLDRLSGSLCDAVTGRKDGRGLLEALERGNLFVVPLDDKRHWYRYHHLFADVLRAHAMEEGADQLAVRHQRASAWYETNGLRSAAINHALAAEDFERAASLVELAAMEMLGSGQEPMLYGWLTALPDKIVRARPVLSVKYAFASLSRDGLEAAEARLRDAERWLETPTNVREPRDAPSGEMVVVDQKGFRSLPGTIAIARAYCAGALGDVAGMMEYAHQALDLLPEEDDLWHGAAAAILGIAYWTSGDLESAYRSFAEGKDRLKTTGYTQFEISMVHTLADIRIAQGRLRDAARIYEQALGQATEQGGGVWGTSDLYVGLSDLHRERNDLEIATQYLLRSKELGEHTALTDTRHRWYVAMARVKAIEGDLGSALDLLDEAERQYVENPDPDVRPIAALKTQWWVAQGRLADALDWVRERSVSVDDDLSYLREFEHLTLARILVARNRREREDRYIHEAVGLLERLLDAAEEGERTGSVIEILVLLALAREAQGDISRALLPLERALTLAEPEGYVRLFVDESAPMAKLLSAANAAGIKPDYTGRLLAAFATEGQNSNPEPPSVTASPSQIEPLSPRELEVLQLVAQGLSNKEISDRLFVALATVKGHNRVIFSKLQVQRRTEAIARGRELGLL